MISWKTTRWTGLAVRARRLDQVPGDRLPLAVGVGRQVDLARLLDALLELLDELGLVPRHQVLRREVVVDVDPERALGQVADVAHRGLHGVAAAQILADRPRLGRRLDDDQPAATWTRKRQPSIWFSLDELRGLCRGAARFSRW